MAETISSSSPLIKRSRFVCKACKGEDNQGAFLFFAPAEDVIDTNEYLWHAKCPQCGTDCQELWYMPNVRKCQGKQTGPTSEAGKNKVRMNGYLTGSSYTTGAIPKVLPPAKPGKYAECDGCHDREECEEEVELATGTCRPVICHRQTEVFAKYRAAHLAGDPEALRLIAAENQARMQLVLNQCLKTVFAEGVLIDSIVVNKDGVVYITRKNKQGVEEAVPLTEFKINPAINESTKILEKMGFSLADWTLTPKSKEAKAALEGYLAGQAAAKGQSVDEFIQKYNQDVKSFHAALEKGNLAAKKDETLREAESEEKTVDV